mmetsp:Transcript_935/g.2677  ORF Transcript_935/g.2677 Transcript_935/m.2677 type:complete len:159 (-) Transcript_935:71-547(-)|eukprot:CAMPEP_0198645788 /NCGR_PEP_ID=MMETSP1467-20131203/1429_1 /TAXON_ID=1462469 /ORGANISM="unid. sp., Strain CCMP2135" /LENGTH=158 /DNA_ID=CAMNT_0044381285 /DNA_START=158 /DNA_END=634 /DNA_ORIENTATION=-
MAGESAAAIFAEIEDKRGGLAEIHTAFRDFPQGVRAHFDLYEGIMLADGLPLSRVEREVIAVAVSRANECAYCVAHHSEALAQAGGIDESKAKLLTDLGTTLTLKPADAPQLKPAFLEAFTPAQFQHAVMVVSYFNFANRCAFAMGLQIEQGFQDTCG